MNQVTRAELKRRAKAYMAGNMGILMLCMVIVFAVTGAVSGLTGLLSEKVPQFSLVGMVLNLAVSAPFTLGIAAVYMQTAKDGTAEIGTLFSGFSRIVDAVVVTFFDQPVYGIMDVVIYRARDYQVYRVVPDLLYYGRTPGDQTEGCHGYFCGDHERA